MNVYVVLERKVKHIMDRKRDPGLKVCVYSCVQRCVWIHVYKGVCVFLCTKLCVFMCTKVCVNSCVQRYMCIHVYKSVCVLMCTKVCVYSCVQRYVCIHVYKCVCVQVEVRNWNWMSSLLILFWDRDLDLELSNSARVAPAFFTLTGIVLSPAKHVSFQSCSNFSFPRKGIPECVPCSVDFYLACLIFVTQLCIFTWNFHPGIPNDLLLWALCLVPIRVWSLFGITTNQVFECYSIWLAFK